MFREQILLLAVFSLFFFSIEAGKNKTFSALFAFGDSILDTGNNNFLLTLSKGNYWPYGWSFDYNIPTGRFGDGRVFSDVVGILLSCSEVSIVAQGLEIKRLVPPYRKVRRLSKKDLKTGVSFASGGSGIDDFTSKTKRVLTVGDQLQDFKEYLVKLKNVAKDKKEVKDIISNAVFLISEGNNDLAYWTVPALVRLYSPNTYTSKMVGWTKIFLQDLYDLGARKFAVLGVMPLGCTPSHRALFGGVFGWCNFSLNKLSQDFNTKLQKGLQSYGVEDNFKGAKFTYVDIYGSLMDIINHPKAFGFSEAKRGCCCMLTAIIPCLNPEKYVFYDFAHPSQKAYEVISKPLIYNMRKGLA